MTATWTLRLPAQLDDDLATAAEAAHMSKTAYVTDLLRRDLWQPAGGDYAEAGYLAISHAAMTCDDCKAAPAEFLAIDGKMEIRNAFCAACVADRLH